MPGTALRPLFDGLQDTVRLQWYKEGLQGIKPGMTAVEIAAGLPLQALHLLDKGARWVGAVVPATQLEACQRVVKQLGLSERLLLSGGSVEGLDLPERVDMVVGDRFGLLGLEGDGLATLLAARDRWLKRDGQVFPSRLRVLAGPVQDEQLEIERRLVTELHGGGLRALWGLPQQPRPVKLDRLAALAHPQRLLELQLGKERGEEWNGYQAFVIQKPGRVHGLGGWLELGDERGRWLSLGPFDPQTSWPQGLLPVTPPPVVKPGDEVFVWLEALREGRSLNTLLQWRVEVRPQ